MRKLGNIIHFTFLSLLFYSCVDKEHPSRVQIKKLNYPSASAIEYFHGKLYVMGDDATHVLILDTNLNIIDSIHIISYTEKRIPKDIKPDLEASALINNILVLFGSGSLVPYRNSGKMLDLKTGKLDTISLETLYSESTRLGIEQINVEGACFIKDFFLLANRGNKSYPFNFFINVSKEIANSDSISFYVSITPFDIQKDTASFQGISGICYAKQTDRLILTVSTEDTRSVYDDGAIGKSYLWFIDSISTKLNRRKISADKTIDLETIDPRFKGQKIESATVTSETNELINLVMVADNDNGSSTIFKLSISKK